MYVNSWRGDAKKEEPGSFECAQRQDQRQWAQNKTGGSVQTSERPLLCEGDQALPQVAMRSGEFGRMSLWTFKSHLDIVLSNWL